MSRKSPEGNKLEFIEQMGLAIADDQAPPMLGRVLGWLLWHAPTPQSAEDLASGLKASRGAISMTVRTLLAVGLVSRRSSPGDRRIYYEIKPDSLARAIVRRFSSLAKMREAIEASLELLAGEPPDRRATLEHMRDMYQFFEDEMAQMLKTWEAKSAQRGKRRK